MDDPVDAGPIVGQAEEEIYPTDTIATLYSRIEDLGVSLLLENIPKMAVGTHSELMQDETRRRIFSTKVTERWSYKFASDLSADI